MYLIRCSDCIRLVLFRTQEEQRKRAAVTRAEGDSKAAELIAKALSGKVTNLIFLRLALLVFGS